MKIRRVFSFVLSLALLVSCCFVFFACSNTQATRNGAVYNENWVPTKKQAMLLIPGLMASSFYNLEEDSFGEELWGTKGFLNLVQNYYAKDVENLIAEFNKKYPNEDFTVYSEYTEAKAGILQGILNSVLSCDENGVPKMTVGVSNMKGSEKFAAFKGMKYIYDILFTNYSNQYDIVVWQYDWRASVDLASSELARFIDECGYEKVQFFTHSLGSVVVANWLQDQGHRDKTELFVPFGGPFLGSMDATINLFSDITESGLIADLMKLVDVSADIRSITTTMPSVYQLMPFSQLYSIAERLDDNTPVQIDGQDATFDEFYDRLETLDFTKKENDELKPFVEDLVDYQNRYFVKAKLDAKTGKYVEDESGEYVHVTWLVPTEYIVGVGCKTTNSVNLAFNAESKTAEMISKDLDMTEFDATGSIYDKYIDTTVTCAMTADENQNIIDTSKYYERLTYGAGDGTVLAYSASAGLPLDAENVHLVYGIPHGPLANNSFSGDFAPDELTGLAYLKGILKKYVKKTDLQIAGTIAPAGTAGVSMPEKESGWDFAGRIIAYVVIGAVVVAIVAFVVTKVVKDSKSAKE